MTPERRLPPGIPLRIIERRMLNRRLAPSRLLRLGKILTFVGGLIPVRRAGLRGLLIGLNGGMRRLRKCLRPVRALRHHAPDI